MCARVPGSASTADCQRRAKQQFDHLWRRPDFKFFRRVAEGMNPELEMGHFLTEKVHFSHVPPLAGSFEYRTEDGTGSTLGILQGFIPNQGDAWKFTLSSIRGFLDTTCRNLKKSHAKKAALNPTN